MLPSDWAVRDALTGLASAPYLRVRLHEIYQECEAAGVQTGSRYELVVVAVDVTRLSGMARLAAMILTATALDLVFSSGETRALLTPEVAVVLSPRRALVPARVLALRDLLERRLAADHLPVDVVHAWRVHLPGGYEAGCRLISTLEVAR